MIERPKLRRSRMLRWSIPSIAIILGALALPAPALADGGMAPLAGAAVPSASADMQDAVATLTNGLDLSTYGGVYVNAKTRAVTVMTVRGQSDKTVLARVAQMRARGYSVTTEAVTRSRKMLEGLRDNGIWNRLPATLEPHVIGTQIDTLRNQVVIEVDSLSTAVRRAVKATYGDVAAVRLTQRPVSMSRYTDFAPYFGGDRLLISYTGSSTFFTACTAGFGATYNGKTVMVTAGHCAPYGNITTPTAVTNGGITGENGCTSAAWCASQTVGSFGTVWQTRDKTFATQAQADANGITVDLALITTTTLAYTYTAGQDSAVVPLASFPGAARTPAGTVCFSGATSSGGCGFAVASEITTEDLDDLYGTVATHHWSRRQVWNTIATNGNRSCAGDSGATVYQPFASGGESILGILSTSNGNADGTVKGQECSTGFGFTFWGQGRAVYPGYTPVIT